VPSQHCLPEQGRDTLSVPRSTVGTRKPLAPKCQIVVFLYKKQNKKKGCYLSQQQDWHPLHPGDTRTRANIKIHIVQDRQDRALSPPPPPSGKQPLSKPRGSEDPPPPYTAKVGRWGPGRRPEAVWPPPLGALNSSLNPSQPADLAIPFGAQHRAAELPPTQCDLGQAPSLAFSSHIKRPHNQKQKGR